jgi:uncharacterized membrane protein
MSDAELKQYDCIFWCDVKDVSLKDIQRLDTHLRGGGGLVVSLGDEAAQNLDGYNRLFYKDGKGLLPGRLMKKIHAPADDRLFFLNAAKEEYYNDPPLNVFKDAKDRETLGKPLFRQYVQVEAAESQGARTLLTFQTWAASANEKAAADKAQEDKIPVASPALIEWNPPLSEAQQPLATNLVRDDRTGPSASHYRGRVLLFTSSLDRDKDKNAEKWSDWPLSYSYLAMMNEMTRLAAPGRLHEEEHLVGELLEEHLPGGAESTVKMSYPFLYPDLKPFYQPTRLIEEVNLFRWSDTDYSGVYRATTSSGQEIPFAVNVPIKSGDSFENESDLRRIDEAKLKDLYPGWKFKVVEDPQEAPLPDAPEDASPATTPVPFGPVVANIVLLMVLGLLFLEILLTWTFGHYTTVDPNLPANTGATGVVVAAVIAVLSLSVFAIGASVIAHERFTGNFLGFFPEILQTWAERNVGVPAPDAGEQTKWTYEPSEFLFGLPAEGWWALALTLAAITAIFFFYRAEAPKVPLRFKLLLGSLRLFLIMTTLWFLLPRPQLQFERLGPADLILMIDNTLSMGEPDTYQDPAMLERTTKLRDAILEKLKQELPEKIKTLTAELAAKAPLTDIKSRGEADGIKHRLDYWKKQQELIQSSKWRPSRLQLVQALLEQPNPAWLKTLMVGQKAKIHIFHLDQNGLPVRLRDAQGDAGEIIDPANPGEIERAARAIAELVPVGRDSQLGTAVKEVISHYQGASLSTVILCTDGVTTLGDSLEQVANYARSNDVKLFFVGLGNEHHLRELSLDNMQVADTIDLGDKAVFDLRVTGKGYKGMTLPIILKLKDTDGQEKEVARTLVKLDPGGKPVRAQVAHTPEKVGKKHYIVELAPPKEEAGEKPLAPGRLRVERTIEVVEGLEKIRVLYVEGQPRYEFRYIKFLLEREALNDKKKKSIELSVLLLDADDDWATIDRAAIANFPATLEELKKYHVLILGDCDPNHKKLKNHLTDIVHFARGETDKGEKDKKAGGGLLFIAGALNNPHRYKSTPLARVLPIETVLDQPPLDVPRVDRMRPELTASGRMHPIFRFSPDDAKNQSIWQRLTPMYWSSGGYKIKPLAEVLAEHPTEKNALASNGRHPLVVQQFVGSGRTMFFGFDETWRWRLRDDEPQFVKFWIQTMRYLARGGSKRTSLHLDQQAPYKIDQKIKVIVQFPDQLPGGPKEKLKFNDKTEVKVDVEYVPPPGKEYKRFEETITLKRQGENWGTFDTDWEKTKSEGRYRFKLNSPDMRKSQPDGVQPGAEAIVEPKPGELDNLRMNAAEMNKTAAETQGRLFTLVNANELLTSLPPSVRSRISAQVPPLTLWNQWWVFAVIIFFMTSEWILRKLKHLL